MCVCVSSCGAHLCVCRTVLNSLRNPLKAMGDVSQNIFMAFILGAIFWSVKQREKDRRTD